MKGEIMREKVEVVLEKLRPYIMDDGGDIEFVKYEDNIVYVHLTGACSGCAHRNNTISNVILSMLQESIEEVKDVKEC